jgi:mannitol-1-phosphate 5-dehydrogenase
MKTFVQYGAGNIGRGFIGQLFSDAGYFVHFIDVDPVIINALNSQKRYPVNIVSDGDNSEVWVDNVDGISGLDSINVAQRIAGCDLMATAVGVNILPRIVPNIIAGIRERVRMGNEKPLNIIICENLINADKLLFQLITEHLDSNEMNYFKEKVGLVEASIGRMVPVMTDEQKQGNVLRVCVESYCELPIDKAAFKGKLPEVPQLLPFEPFEYYIMRKLFIHNMGHALTAYLGALLNYEYIWQSVENRDIRLFAQRAMKESALALSGRFNVPLVIIENYIDDLLNRFGNKALGDTVARVGRDTNRKLSANDRFAGAIKLCEEQGVLPVHISAGIAAGFIFDDDNGNQLKTKLAEDGIDNTLADICSLKDRKGFIKKYYEYMKNGYLVRDLLILAEQFSEISPVTAKGDNND